MPYGYGAHVAIYGAMRHAPRATTAYAYADDFPPFSAPCFRYAVCCRLLPRHAFAYLMRRCSWCDIIVLCAYAYALRALYIYTPEQLIYFAAFATARARYDAA